MTESGILADRVALVTGAGGGLGTGVRDVFTSSGATIVQGDLDAAEPDWRWFDATDAASGRAAVQGAIEHYGKIDILINLVGTWMPQPPVAEMPYEDVARLFKINFQSAYVMSQATLPNMIESGWGRIINVGAKQALKGVAGNVAYGASKAALLNLTETLAAENAAHGITANAIIPSTIDTPANREAMPDANFSNWVTPRAIGEAMAFLCTEAGGSINGARVPVLNRS